MELGINTMQEFVAILAIIGLLVVILVCVPLIIHMVRGIWSDICFCLYDISKFRSFRLLMEHQIDCKFKVGDWLFQKNYSGIRWFVKKKHKRGYTLSTSEMPNSWSFYELNSDVKLHYELDRKSLLNKEFDNQLEELLK